jgi:hypothetical protein
VDRLHEDPKPDILAVDDPILIPPLCPRLEFPIDNLWRSPHLSSIAQWRTIMLDLVFLALGLAGFALMAAYAVLCDRL